MIFQEQQLKKCQLPSTDQVPNSYIITQLLCFHSSLMMIDYNLLAAHTVLMRTELSPQKWTVTCSPHSGLCALHQHQAVLVSRWSACATVSADAQSPLYDGQSHLHGVSSWLQQFSSLRWQVLFLFSLLSFRRSHPKLRF